MSVDSPGLPRFVPDFYRCAAIASVLSAATTLALILLPDLFAPSTGFEGRMARVQDPAYAVRAWTYFVHPFLAATAALAVAVRLRRDAASLVVPGLLAFLLWAALEIAQQGVTLFAFDRWRLAFLAGDEAVRSTMLLRTALYDGLWDALYFPILVAFLLGCTCYALAFRTFVGLGRVVGALYALAAVLTALLVIREVGGPTLPDAVTRWMYLLGQPAARVLIGVWLWRNADETSPVAARSSADAR